MRRILLLLPLLWLAGCSDRNPDDLKQFVKTAGSQFHAKIAPLPEVKPYQAFIYNDDAMQDPFKPRKLAYSLGDGGLHPDFNRARQLLESYPLDKLKMVGTVALKGQRDAIIKTPDNTVYIVKAGNYLGTDFGKVVTISDHDIKLKEFVQDGVGNWLERYTTLTLQDK
jgi:type IV pilus assembly protein PilP